MAQPAFVFVFMSMIAVGKSQTATSTAETPLPNPAFENIAPCPCDLTSDLYDNNCCCDPDLTEPDKNISDCLQGNFGGNFTFVNDAMCRADQSNTVDWFPFTCIQFLNSPDLGLYYYPAPSIQANLPVGSPYTYAPVNPNSTTACGGNQCNYGDAVKGSRGDNSFLTLPQNSINGNCVAKSPVRYLIDTSSACDVTVDATTCAGGGQLDAKTYTASTANSGNIIEPTVTYLCASPDDPLYTKTSDGSPTATVGVFNATDAPRPLGCVGTPGQISEDGTTCRNAVASVSYAFVWSGGFIISFNVTITLVNVSFTTPGDPSTGVGPNNVLTQTFSTTFTPVSSTGATVSQSGNPGYEFGLPVISGVDSAGVVDTASRLKILTPTSSGLCANASGTAPVFGYDVITGCTLVFGSYNCTELRQNVENQQLQLLGATLVSRFGNPSTSAFSTDWIGVLSNFTDFTEENATEGQCQGIPSRVELRFLWAKTGEQNGVAIREIVGASTSWTRETWQIRCAEGEGGCALNTYAIYSSVSFVEVPPQAPVAPTAYELNRNDTCKKDATCWPELLLPIQSEFFYQFDIDTAHTLRSYNYAWALLVTFFSIAAALVPSRWGSVGRYLKQVLPL